MRGGGPSVLGIVLAGGAGKRLMPLTADRAKPAVIFGGTYRLVDFVLSNLVNGGILRICVLTQYKSHSLDRHVTTTWRMSSLLGNYVTPVPAQQRLGPRWYLGSADAILQSLNLVHDEQPDYIAVFGADHVYRMDPRQMLDQHVENGAGVTVAGHQGAQGRRLRVRRDHPGRRRDTGGPLPGEAGRPAGAARRPHPGLRLDGQLPVHHQDAAGGAARGRRGPAVRARHGRQHPAAAHHQGRRPGLRLRRQPGARRDRPRPRLLARRRHPGRLLRRAHGPDLRPARVQPLQPRLADLHQPRLAAARRRSRRAASWGSRWSAPAA